MHAKLLVVDDDEYVLAYLCSLLEREEYSVIGASGGGEALRLLDSHDFDIVISDLMMPEFTGLKVLEELRKKKPDTGFMLITAYGSMNSAIKALRLGAADYLVKPFEEEELLIRVRNIYEKQAIRRERDARARELESLVFAISHDLAGHLVALRGFAQRFRAKFGPLLPQEATIYLDRIDSSSALMERLVAGISSYARLGKNGAARVEAVNLNEVVEEVLQNLHGMITEKGALVQVMRELPVIQTEWVRAYQVFHNLVTNSLKFSREGARPEITLDVEEHGTYYRFYVRDNGIGIRKEDQDKIFEMFGRAGARTASPGTGLGLAIVRKIIEQAGGEIWVESEEGEGATFCFTFPKAPSLARTIPARAAVPARE